MPNNDFRQDGDRASKDAPIGVFDSGVGGLTVAKEIMNEIPNESIIYFGDTARVPYGTKSKTTIIGYTRQIVKFLISKKVKAIVIACNTASAFALEEVSKEFATPIIGVIEAGAKMASLATRNGKVGIIATEGTIRSGIYNRTLQKINPTLQVFGKACPLFVSLAEEGWIDDPITLAVAERYINELTAQNIDTLILGCTHYPLLRNTIKQVVGDDVELVNPALETAKELKELLTVQNLINTKKVVDHRFYVSDGAEKFRSFANSILPCEVVETKDVNIESLSE